MPTATSTNGKAVQIDRAGETAYLLYDFDIEGTTLKYSHMATLRDKIVPVLKAGGSLTVIGMASRTGPEGRNLTISSTRAGSALSYLQQINKSSFKVSKLKGVGSQVAVNQKQAPNTENERYRSVYVSAWTKPDPPPAPPPSTKLPDGSEIFGQVVPEPQTSGDGPLDKIGKALDVAGFLTGVGELLLAGLLAEIMSILGAIAGIVSAIIALPGAWSAQDKVARFNGYCRGFWDAFQDMANGFKDSSLDTKPYDQWPAIPKPTPHYDMSVKEENLLVAARAEREGWRRGCNEAYEKMTGLETNPKDYTDKKKNKTYKVTGKLLLRALYKWKGSDVGEEVKKAINKKLRESGQSEWPVH